MTFPEVPEKLIKAMLNTGALVITRTDQDDVYVRTDYLKMSKQFPGYMQDFVRASLDEHQKDLYARGYIAYIINPNGTLHWKATGKEK